MIKSNKACAFLQNDSTFAIFKKMYGEDQAILKHECERYKVLIALYEKYFKGEAEHFFSSPGRIEIGGNHTDHNNGRVLAATTHLDTIGLAAPTETTEVVVYSEGYATPFKIDFKQTLKPQKKYEGTTTALIQGIIARFQELDYKVGGFNAVVSTQILIGSGLSASASIEVLIATMLNAFFNDNKIDPETIAKICQYAENVFFMKPCGLMDQMMCAVGGIASIDFKDPNNPIVHKADFDFKKHNYQMIVVNTGGDHTHLKAQYAAIPEEMQSVAKVLGGSVCREISLMQLIEKITVIRSKVGDRAVLRAYHFMAENQRVLDQIYALQNSNLEDFLKLVNASGDSSAKWLQNSYDCSNVLHQGISVGLAMTEYYLKKIGEGACRVHGGGFAGTILIFLPEAYVDDYQQFIRTIFGVHSSIQLAVRPFGALHLNSYVKI